MSSPQSFVRKAGDFLQFMLTVTNEDTGAAADLTGVTIRFVVARKPGATPVLEAPATVTAVISGNPLLGLIDVQIDGDNTEVLVGTYYYECEIEDGVGRRNTIAFGYLTFEKDLA